MFVKTFSMKLLYIIAILIIIPFCVKGQYTILMLSGEVIKPENYKISEMGNTIVYKDNVKEENELDFDYIFSITDSLGNEQIIYKPDTAKEDFMSVDQMRDFIKGEIEARENYKCPLCFIGGIAVGAGSVFGTPYILPTILYSPLFPAASSSVVGFTSPNRSVIVKKHPEYANNEPYIQGYKECASQKRLKSSIFGSGIGLAVGVVSFIVIGLVK